MRRHPPAVAPRGTPSRSQLTEFVARWQSAQAEVDRIIRFAGMSDLDLVVMRHKVIEHLGQSVPCERDQVLTTGCGCSWQRETV